MAKKALKEHFNTTVQFDGLSLYDTERMMRKVGKLMSEMHQKSSGVNTEQNPSYLKLVFMEQALTHHYGELKALPMYNTRIVTENEEVEKSQVILAAQEMVDAIQKMVEQVSDMLVKELPAVVDGVNSEVGTEQGTQFNTQAAEALAALQGALTQSKAGIQGALGVITGQGAMAMPGAGMGDEMGADMGADMGDEMGADMDNEFGSDEIPEPPEEVSSVGRASR
jgi:hypothetical protein